MNDIEELIRLLKSRGLSNGSALGHHSGLFEATADTLTALMEENAQLRTKLKNAQESHAFWMEEEMGVQKQLCAELEQAKQERDSAVSCIYEIEDDLDRGTDNDWARENTSQNGEVRRKGKHETVDKKSHALYDWRMWNGQRC